MLVSLFVVFLLLAIAGVWLKKNEDREVLRGGVKADDYEVNTPVRIDEDGWSRFESTKYKFSLPPDWHASKSDQGVSKRENLFKEGESLFLSNVDGTVRIIITPGQVPYGIESGDEKTNELKVMVAGQEYSVLETETSEYGRFVDFEVKNKDQSIFILFGTGYPVTSGTAGSVSDYEKERNNILKVLASLEFIN